MLRRRVRLALTPVLVVWFAHSLVGQSPAQHLATDSIFQQLSVALLPSDVPSDFRCAGYTSAMLHLCKGVLAAKRAELTADADAAIAAERELRQVVEGEPTWASGWYAMGITRLALARAAVLAKPGPLQILGMSWEAGAGHALVRSLELDSTNSDAATALALAGIPREGKAQLGKRLDMLRRIRPLLGPAALLGAARVERVAGSRDSAAALFERALASGVVDSGFVATQLARELYASNRAEAGAQVLIRGASTTTKEGQTAYRRELEWVAEPSELAAWDSVPAVDRPAWLRQFWAGRDVQEGWPDGTRLVEHYRRIETAWKDFTLALPPSGRQISASTTGGIDTFVDELIERRMSGAEGVSFEQDAVMAGKAVSNTSDEPLGGRETQAGAIAAQITDGLLIASQMKALGLGGPFRAFRTTQDVLDDRGVVWIRYGKPDKMVSSAGGVAMQVWAYDHIEPRLVLQFQEENFVGQAGATRLVPTLLNVAGRFRDQFCGIEPSLCAVNTSSEDLKYNDASPLKESGVGLRYADAKTDGGRLTPAVVDRIVRTGAAQVVRATTTDANPRVFTKAVDPIVQLYGLATPGGGQSVALAAFAIPGDQLDGTQPPAAGGRTVYAVRMMLSLLDGQGRRVDIDTLRNFAVASPLEKGQFLSGTLEVPLPPGRYRGSLLISQADGRGAVATLPGIGVPGPGTRLTISSVVLGREGSGTIWRSGNAVVALNPLGAFTEKGQAELYYQVAGQAPGTSYQTTLEFFDASSPDKSALTLRFDEHAEATFREVHRTVGLANLKPGQYRLKVTVTGGGASATETAFLAVVKG
ncbi:MAG TPA: hypothetical protein VFN22_11875 [Gemmatimonadales bacterium]|nr:hypothetical protein [Gemmatimonadales bacterium]